MITPTDLSPNFSANFSPELYKRVFEQLHGFGECTFDNKENYPLEYQDFPVNADTIPVLLALVDDLDRPPVDESLAKLPEAVWVPIHAARVLSTHQVPEAIDTIIATFFTHNHDDWVNETFPEMLCLYGEKIVQDLLDELMQEDQIWYSDVCGYASILRTLELLATNHPAVLSDVCQSLRHKLEEYRFLPPSFTSFIIHTLVTLKDSASVELIQEIFACDFLDLEILNWKFVHTAFPLIAELPEIINPNYKLAWAEKYL